MTAFQERSGTSTVFLLTRCSKRNKPISHHINIALMRVLCRPHCQSKLGIQATAFYRHCTTPAIEYQLSMQGPTLPAVGASGTPEDSSLPFRASCRRGGFDFSFLSNLASLVRCSMQLKFLRLAWIGHGPASKSLGLRSILEKSEYVMWRPRQNWELSPISSESPDRNCI